MEKKGKSCTNILTIFSGKSEFTMCFMYFHVSIKQLPIKKGNPVPKASHVSGVQQKAASQEV